MLAPMFYTINVYDKAVATGGMPNLMSLGISARVTDVLLALVQSTRSARDLNEARFLKAFSWLELEIVTGGDPQMLASQMSTALHRPR